jgi:hypothetical protein
LHRPSETLRNHEVSPGPAAGRAVRGQRLPPRAFPQFLNDVALGARRGQDAVRQDLGPGERAALDSLGCSRLFGLLLCLGLLSFWAVLVLVGCSQLWAALSFGLLSAWGCSCAGLSLCLWAQLSSPLGCNRASFNSVTQSI